MKLKITKKIIDKIAYDLSLDGKKQIIWDTDMTGFGLRLYPSDKKSFVLSYRHNGKKREYTIGQYGKITLDQARKLAQKCMGDIADGEDPVAQRRNDKKRNSLNVENSFQDFINRHAKIHTKNWYETQRIFEKDILPAIGSKSIDEVIKSDVYKILDRVMNRKAGIMANRTLSVLRKFFNWCIERGYISNSPAYMVRLPAKKKTRDRVLNENELSEIWNASFEIGYPCGDIIRILLLTGQRRGEVAKIEWGNVNQICQEWIQPADKTKNGKEHRVFLTDACIQTISNVPKMGDYIFSSTGKKTFDNFSRDKNKIDKIINKQRELKGVDPIQPWTIHDIRRSVASGMAKQGIAPHVIEKILNHSSGTISGVAKIYNRYEYKDECDQALTQWSDRCMYFIQNE